MESFDLLAALRYITMGMYNTYDGVQLKVSRDLTLKEFKRGDKCDLKDGAYLGPDGLVVIHDRKVLRSYKYLTHSHGGKFAPWEMYFNSLNTIGKIKEITGWESAVKHGRSKNKNRKSTP